MKPKIDLKILPATIKDRVLFFNFLNTNFFPEEPMGKTLGVTYKKEEELGGLLEVLADGLSFRAVNASDDSEDNSVGVVLNAIKTQEEWDQDKEANQSSCPEGLKKIFKILEHLEKKSDFWNRVKVDKVFDTIFVSVRPDCRGLDIGKKLIEKSLEHAKSLDYNYATVECSSIYSSKIAAKLGYEVFYDQKYDEYRDENNEVIIPVEPPHPSIILFVKKL